MAWQAIVAGFDLDAPSVTVSYYDDTAPDTILYTRAFTRGEFGTPADLRAAVIAVGQRQRALYNRVQTIKATGPIAIP